MKKIISSIALIGLMCSSYAQKYNADIQKFKKREFSEMQLKDLALNARKLGDYRTSQRAANLYTDKVLTRLKINKFPDNEQLDFIGDFIASENSRAFKFFKKESVKINAVLGEHKSEDKIMDFIDRKYLPQLDFKIVKAHDWDNSGQILIRKFGYLGKERFYGQRMLYHWMVKDDWSEFAKYYLLYFKIALSHSRYHINNMSWAIFEHVNDPFVLNFACNTVMKYAIEEKYQNDPSAYDTYANLLYKCGYKQKAVEWEERAVRQSMFNLAMVETLNKMKINM